MYVVISSISRERTFFGSSATKSPFFPWQCSHSTPSSCSNQPMISANCRAFIPFSTRTSLNTFSAGSLRSFGDRICSNSSGTSFAKGRFAGSSSPWWHIQQVTFTSLPKVRRLISSFIRIISRATLLLLRVGGKVFLLDQMTHRALLAEVRAHRLHPRHEAVALQLSEHLHVLEDLRRRPLALLSPFKSDRRLRSRCRDGAHQIRARRAPVDTPRWRPRIWRPRILDSRVGQVGWTCRLLRGNRERRRWRLRVRGRAGRCKQQERSPAHVLLPLLFLLIDELVQIVRQLAHPSLQRRDPLPRVLEVIARHQPR